uniref:ShKT domain-containing protein n=1 Tax=Acrobeloides nanus TaxID=290746 RepID=A0A914D668_9BILA
MVFLMGLLAVFDMTIALQCPNSNLSEDDRNFILNLHNSARSNVAKGLEPNGPPSNNANVPGASNMYKLSYDCKAEAIIQAYTDKCVDEHSFVNTENLWNGGQGVWWGIRDALNSAGTIWWAELRQNGVTNTVISNYTFNGGIVGHWSAMAWADATRIGCGVTNCTTDGTKWTLASCVYFWRANMAGSPIWNIGNACAVDSDCSYYLNSTCDISTSLCQAQCVNYLPDASCNSYVASGYCDSSSQYSSWVQQRCPVACNSCPVDPLKPDAQITCQDAQTYCPNWQAQGYCSTSSPILINKTLYKKF